MPRLKKLCSDDLCPASTDCLRHPHAGAYTLLLDQDYGAFDREAGHNRCSWFVLAKDYRHLWDDVGDNHFITEKDFK